MELEWKYKKVKFPDGKYEGQMKGGKVRFGFGTFWYDDGRVYEGEFVEDLLHGQGEMRWPNKEVYKGEFSKGLPHGIGVFVNALGILETRVYENGKLKSGEKLEEYSKNYKEDTSKANRLRYYRKYIQQIPITPVSGMDHSGKHPRTHECPNFRAAWNFIEFKMKMDTKWFRFDYNFCFCRTCIHRGFTSDVHKTDTRGGKKYGYPFGWMKVGLPVPPFFSASGSLDNWHVGFHGTRCATAKIIIEQSRGGLLLPGDVTPSGFKLPVVNPIDRDEDWTRQFFMSPSIKYCETIYTPAVEFNGDLFRVAFQVRIEPGTYKIGPQTIGHDGEIDPLFENDKLEWFTNRRNVAVLSGLMIKRIFNGAKEETQKETEDVKTKKEKEEEEEEEEGEGEGEEVEKEETKEEKSGMELENEKLKKEVGELKVLVETLKKEIEELKKK